jgi:hypothetical protein
MPEMSDADEGDRSLLNLFFEAADEGDLHSLERLLAVHPGLATASNGEQQAIHLAARQNHADLVALLLKSGADANAVDFEDNTPLHLAAEHGPETVAVLLQHGPDLNALDWEGSTPLLKALAGQTSAGEQVAELLRHAGAAYGLTEAACVADLDTVRAMLTQDPAAVARAPSADRLLTITTCVGWPGTVADRVVILELLFAGGLRASRSLLVELVVQPIPLELKAVVLRHVHPLGSPGATTREGETPTVDSFSDILWGILGWARKSKDTLQSLLWSLPREALVLFHKEFRGALYNLWRASDAGGWLIPERDGYISDDGKEDIFAYVVSQGRRYYNEVLAHPERLRRDIQPGDVPFLGVAGQVYWDRFGDEINLQ